MIKSITFDNTELDIETLSSLDKNNSMVSNISIIDNYISGGKTMYSMFNNAIDILKNNLTNKIIEIRIDINKMSKSCVLHTENNDIDIVFQLFLYNSMNDNNKRAIYADDEVNVAFDDLFNRVVIFDKAFKKQIVTTTLSRRLNH